MLSVLPILREHINKADFHETIPQKARKLRPISAQRRGCSGDPELNHAKIHKPKLTQVIKFVGVIVTMTGFGKDFRKMICVLLNRLAGLSEATVCVYVRVCSWHETRGV